MCSKEHELTLKNPQVWVIPQFPLIRVSLAP
jgi:hypothetical protein